MKSDFPLPCQGMLRRRCRRHQLLVCLWIQGPPFGHQNKVDLLMRCSGHSVSLNDHQPGMKRGMPSPCRRQGKLRLDFTQQSVGKGGA